MIRPCDRRRSATIALFLLSTVISASGLDVHDNFKTKTSHEKIPVSRNASEIPQLATADPSLALNPRLPTHNFWPWIPVIGFGEHTTTTITQKDQPASMLNSWKKMPSHNFWPWIPLMGSGYPRVGGNQTRKVHIPEHSFWPLIPVPRGALQPGHKKIPPSTQLPPVVWPSGTLRYNYGEVLYKSILFYEVQRSGRLPKDRKILWRGDSAVDDRGLLREDLSGGWYDSGDYVKFGLPMASSVTMLLWGLVTFPQAYASVDLLDDVRDSVKWPLDYFIKAHTNKYSFYGQVGDPYLDHAYWGRPEDMDMERPAYILTPERPGSDLVGETSAAMAAGYLAFRDVDPLYAETLLTHAQVLFEFAESFRGVYSDSIPNAAEFYKSSRDEDELAWAAAWLYKATGHRSYLSKAVQWLARAPSCWAQSWDDKTCGATVLLYHLTKDSSLKSSVQEILQTWLPGGGIQYTPKGLAYRSPWGALRYTANMALVALVAAESGVNPDLYRRWAVGQIHYMLGDGERSYVVGFGKDPPTRPHHASSFSRVILPILLLASPFHPSSPPLSPCFPVYIAHLPTRTTGTITLNSFPPLPVHVAQVPGTTTLNSSPPLSPCFPVHVARLPTLATGTTTLNSSPPLSPCFPVHVARLPTLATGTTTRNRKPTLTRCTALWLVDQTHVTVSMTTGKITSTTK